MQWTVSNEDVFVRLDPGDEIHASLQNLADEIGFDAAAITSGIGRTSNTLYGYMNEEGVYIRRELLPPLNWSVYLGILLEHKMVNHSPTYTVAGLMTTMLFMQDICSNL